MPSELVVPERSRVCFNFNETRKVDFTRQPPDYFIIQVAPNAICPGNVYQLQQAIREAASHSSPHTTIIVEGDVPAALCRTALTPIMEKYRLQGGFALTSRADKIFISGFDDVIDGSSEKLRYLYRESHHKAHCTRGIHEVPVPEAADLVKGISDAKAVVAHVLSLSFRRACQAEGLDAKKVLGSSRMDGSSDPPDGSNSSYRSCSASLREILPDLPLVEAALAEQEFQPYTLDDKEDEDFSEKNEARTMELKMVFDQAKKVIDHYFSMTATSVCATENWSARRIFGFEYSFANLDELHLESLSHHLFRIPVVEMALMALKAYPVSLAKRLVSGLEEAKRDQAPFGHIGDDLDSLKDLSILVASIGDESGCPVSKNASIFAAHLAHQSGIELRLADAATHVGEEGKNDDDQRKKKDKKNKVVTKRHRRSSSYQLRWIDQQLTEYDAVVLLLPDHQSLNRTALKSGKIDILEGICYVARQRV